MIQEQGELYFRFLNLFLFWLCLYCLHLNWGSIMTLLQSEFACYSMHSVYNRGVAPCTHISLCEQLKSRRKWEINLSLYIGVFTRLNCLKTSRPLLVTSWMAHCFTFFPQTLLVIDNTRDENKTTGLLLHFPSYLFTENVLRKTQGMAFLSP